MATGTIIVETGAVVPFANAYIGVADAVTYATRMGYMPWVALPEAQQEQTLIQACQYMVGVYRMRWAELRVQPGAIPNPALGGAPGSLLSGQALDWPRIGVILKDTASFFVDQRLSYTVPANLVPQEVQYANVELAVRASTQDLWPDLDQRTLVEKVG